MDTHCNIHSIELDAIKEVGNIGVGNAAIALSRILNKTVEMDVPDTKFIPISTFAHQFGSPDTIVMSIYSPIIGDLTGETLFVFSRECAMGLVDLMMGNSPGQTRVMDELSESAFKEMANIFVGSYLNAISDMVGFKLLPGIPVVSTDMIQAILDNLLIKVSEYADNVLCSSANIAIEGHDIQGDFLFIFDTESMTKLTTRLNEAFSAELPK